MAADRVRAAGTARQKPATTRPPLAAMSAGSGSIMDLQRLAGNRAVTGLLSRSGALPVQRVKDAFDVKLTKESLALASPFKQKHVAEDEAAAIAATHARYTSGKMPVAMQNGNMANTVAPAASWLNAVDASETKVDTEDKAWTNDVALEVDSPWNVRWNPRRNDYDVSKPANRSLKAGGYAEVQYAAGGKKKKAKQVTDGSFIVDHIGNG